MKVLKLEADNFKNLKAVEITPDGQMVVVGGKNEQGKSSVMDAIWVALKGRSVAPPKPIRNGEEECRIAVDLGELRVVRKFTAKPGGTYTDSVKVENDAGLRYGQPQQVLDALLGTIGFDPFDFTRQKPEKQAETLLQMVPLSVDLDELAEADASDYSKRRDVNRDALQVKAQFEAIPREEVPEGAPDREALVAKLSAAAETNGAIERERMRRENAGLELGRRVESVERGRDHANSLREQARRLIEEADGLDKDSAERAAAIEKDRAALEALPDLDEPVDAEAVRRELSEAEASLATIERQSRRRALEARYRELTAESEGYTAAMERREEDRRKALSEAVMPIEGLAFAIDEKGKAAVMLNGVPFEQASTAAKLKASTAIAMAANPELRILRISDGSLLDEDSIALLRGMAEADDFQLWVEVVGEGSNVGIVMENGEVRAAPPEKAKPEPKVAAKPEADKPAVDGALL